MSPARQDLALAAARLTCRRRRSRVRATALGGTVADRGEDPVLLGGLTAP